MSEPVVYELKFPIVTVLTPKGGDAREEEITEVTVRRAKARDLRVLDRNPGKMGQTLALIGALTGLTPIQVDKLDGEDIAGLGEIIGDFFPVTPPTGETS